MKWPNFKFFIETGLGFRDVFLRFPLAVFSSIVFVYFAGFSRETYSLLVSSGVGIPLFILASLASEGIAFRNQASKRFPTPLAGALLIAYGFTIHFSYDEELYTTFAVRLATIILVIHLAIAFLPTLLARSGGFATWEFNKTLLSRFLVTAFYSAVFYIGTVLALVSIKELFGIRIDDDIFFRLWLFFAFFFNTVLFLGGVPKLSDLKSGFVEVTAWIQFLCKFILLPLVVLYFGILYAYLAKIALAWSWPDGMVGYPVLILSVIGGLTALLMWPLSGDENGTPWAKKFWQWFFPMTIPLSVVLILALHKRIAIYGFTELRYSGLVLAIWLLGISLFYTLRRQSSFRMVPISLCGIIFICLAGPLSPRHIGQQSQRSRLMNQLAEEGWLLNGTLINNPHSIPREQYDQLTSAISYLRSYYGPEPFQKWVEQIPDQDSKLPEWDRERLYPYQLSEAITSFIGATPEASPGDQRYLNFNLDQESSYDFGTASRFYLTQMHEYSGYQGLEIELDGISLFLRLIDKGQQLAIQDANSQTIDQIDFTDWVAEKGFDHNSAQQQYNPQDADALSFTLDLGRQRGTLHVLINHAQFVFEEGKWRARSGQLFVFVPADRE